MAELSITTQQEEIQSWRIRIKERSQEEVLKSKGRIVYHYSFNGDLCK
jgi:hypothetical protein